jgi:hypothetical protein
MLHTTFPTVKLLDAKDSDHGKSKNDKLCLLLCLHAQLLLAWSWQAPFCSLFHTTNLLCLCLSPHLQWYYQNMLLLLDLLHRTHVLYFFIFFYL